MEDAVPSQLTYFGRLGEHSSELIRYLEAVPGVQPFVPGHNPATWMLVRPLPQGPPPLAQLYGPIPRHLQHSSHKVHCFR